jgi:S-adenosylmethionine hydrolase
VRLGRTFGDVAEGDLILLIDSAGHLAVARRAGSAARHTGLKPCAVVELTITPDT